MDIAATVLAGAVGGIFSAGLALLGTILSSRWKIAEENILKERAKWREEVRSLIKQLVVASDAKVIESIATALALRLNPEIDDDKDDREIVAMAFSLMAADKRTNSTKERIVALTAHVLKHDWTRAKWEGDRWFWEKEPIQKKFTGPKKYELPPAPQLAN